MHYKNYKRNNDLDEKKIKSTNLKIKKKKRSKENKIRRLKKNKINKLKKRYKENKINKFKKENKIKCKYSIHVHKSTQTVPEDENKILNVQLTQTINNIVDKIQDCQSRGRKFYP